jgi:hypothetical protein
MNFMPSEDAFFDEPLHNDMPVPQNIAPKSNVAHQAYPFSPQILPPPENANQLLLESSIRQEKLLERLLTEMERVNKNLIELRLSRENSQASSPGASPSSAAGKSVPTSSNPSRGTLILPPGSRPISVPNVPEKKPLLSPAEEIAAREQEEREAILRRRADEEARLARIEVERLEREAEEERKRIAEMKRIEDEKRMKEELERKTRGLMTGLITSSAAGGLFGDDDLDMGSNGKKQGGLFDD